MVCVIMQHCYISLVVCLLILNWSSMLCVKASLEIRLQGNAVSITLWEGEIRWCLTVALLLRAVLRKKDL